MSRLLEHLEKIPPFLEIVRTGSMSRAAVSLRLTQPALSRSIRTLESILNVTLFVRSNKGLKPTSAGLRLFAFGEKLTENTQYFEKHFLHSSHSIEGIVKVGTYESIALYYWPKVIQALHQQFPKLEIQLETAASPEIQKSLLKGNIDLAVTVLPSPHPQIEIHPLFEDYFGLFQAPSLRVDFDTPIMVSRRALEVARGPFSRTLSRFNLSRHPKYEIANLEVIAAYTEEGLGIGVLPHRVAAKKMTTGKIVPYLVSNESLNEIPNRFGRHTIEFSFLKNQNHERKLIEMVLAVCRKHLQ